MSARAAEFGHEGQSRLRVGVGVVGDVVAFLDLAPRQRRLGVELVADGEEGRAHALVGERLENLRRRALVRAVVEGEDHFVVGERDRRRIGLQPDQQAAFRPDFERCATCRACPARTAAAAAPAAATSASAARRPARLKGDKPIALGLPRRRGVGQGTAGAARPRPGKDDENITGGPSPFETRRGTPLLTVKGS